MKPDEILDYVQRALEFLIEKDRPHDGLFLSIIDFQSGEMPSDLPESVFGQRDCDRSHPGSNLIHDEPLLQTLYALAESQKRPDYTEAADRCIERFATHCTDTITGLFPWGEHSFWHLLEDRVGNAYRNNRPEHDRPTHDHLRQVPEWLWSKLNELNPEWYESQMGPSFLLQGLARLALLALDGEDCLGPNYTYR
ncbi:MAG: hypothetical protein ACLFWL_03100 [Candidatus Brocadiia bacterium]